jgi:hypothetical protein
MESDLSITMAKRGSARDARIIESTGSNKAKSKRVSAMARNDPSKNLLKTVSGGFVT